MSDDDKGNKLARVEVGFATALEPTTRAELKELATWIADMGWGGIKDPRDAALRIVAGRALGFSAIQSVQEISVIKGKPTASAKSLLAKCYQHPDCEYFTLVESTDDVATFKTKRRGNDEVRLSFTFDDAKRLGLAGNDNYTKQRATMLMWRCAMKLARPVYPDALMGFYANEEMSGSVAPADDFVVTPEPPRVALKPAPAPPPSDVQPVEERGAMPEASFDEVADPAHDLPAEKSAEELEASFLRSVDTASSVASLNSVYHNAKYSGLDADAMGRIVRACSARKAAIVKAG